MAFTAAKNKRAQNLTKSKISGITAKEIPAKKRYNDVETTYDRERAMKRERALFDEIIFPNGKSKAFTMSYDDGTIHDRRLVEIMNRYGIRGTFNLNAGFLGQTCWIGGLHGKLDIR